MSAEQRAKLAAAQRAYVARDPRWHDLLKEPKTVTGLPPQLPLGLTLTDRP